MHNGWHPPTRSLVARGGQPAWLTHASASGGCLARLVRLAGLGHPSSRLARLAGFASGHLARPASLVHTSGTLARLAWLAGVTSPAWLAWATGGGVPWAGRCCR